MLGGPMLKIELGMMLGIIYTVIMLPLVSYLL
jgi:hypothetical protein